MSSPIERRDFLPSTATASAMRSATGIVAPELRRPVTPGREIEIDPDAPNAPVCSGRRYVVADPDAPDAPTCKPKRYIVAPDPETRDEARLPSVARELGVRLAEEFGERG